MRKDAIQELVGLFFQQQHSKKQLVLLRVITRLVNARVIEVRFVCEFMLNSLYFVSSPQSNTLANSTNSNPAPSANASNAHLPNTNLVNMRGKTGGKETPTYIWCKILEFIRRLIPTLDYKSCRDIFKMLLELTKRIQHSNSSVPPPLENEILCVSKSGVKHKLDTVEVEHIGQDLASNKILLQNSSRVTDNIKLESLFEVNSISNHNLV